MKKIIRRAKKDVSNAIQPKIKLTKETIIINPNSWRQFNADRFPSEYSYVQCGIERISPNDYHYVVAIIGSTNKFILPKLEQLRWVQLPSHGFNGYDNAQLYLNKNICVSNVKDVFALPIAQYCIACYYFAKSYALKKLVCKDLVLDETFSDVRNITVAVFGLGNIGLKIAELSKLQGWKVIGVKRTVPKMPIHNVDVVYTLDSVKKELSQIDYVINILPETSETVRIYNYDFFWLTKRNVCFL